MAKTKKQRKKVDIAAARASWARAENAYEYLRDSIRRRHLSKRHLKLEVEDLVYVSNFKGGQGAITEPTINATRLLKIYSKHLEDIRTTLGRYSLKSLPTKSYRKLKKQCDAYLSLCINERTKIRGFGPAYAAALASAYFPDALPVIDYRVVNGARLKIIKKSGKKQLSKKEIISFYGPLLAECRKILKRRKSTSLRQLDKELFCKPLA